MKKIYLFILSAIPFASFAQTIDQSDLPFAGLGWISGVDTNYSAAIPPGGAGQSWDFSNLQYDYVDTSAFIDAAGTPHAGLFPSANLAGHRPGTNEWSYFITNATGMYVNGFVNDTISFVLDPPQMYVPVPFSYGDTHVDYSRVEIDTEYMSIPAKIIIHFQGDFIADGSGTLVTPASSYPSVLRVKQTLLETDSLMVDFLGNGNYTLFGTFQRQETFYRWYTHGGTANYILGIDADSLGTTANRSDYLLQWAVLGTDDLSDAGFYTYPDPASTNLTIRTGNEPILSVEVFNIAGQKIYSTDPASAFSHEIDIDVSEWTPGIYYYRALTANKTRQGKFMVMD